MTFAKPLFLLGALTLVAACEATPAPQAEAAAGPIETPNSLNGTYNLNLSACGAEEPNATKLVVSGNRFEFAGSSCTVAESKIVGSVNRVTLSCDGAKTGGNRVVALEKRGNELKMTEDRTVLRYQKCPALVVKPANQTTIATPGATVTVTDTTKAAPAVVKVVK